ncbi:MBG domain-containing protein [Lentilactobacillus otakiensis]|uniref:MBG domain-containing protein n=1 Tax=Lentilactobacillus otakiensis TaxID=481720 RepID=UPI003D18106D
MKNSHIVSIMYDGSIHKPSAGDYTITMSNGKQVTLQDSDLTITGHNNGVSDVGNYSVDLSEAGKTRIGNLLGSDFTLVGGSSTATFNITKQKGTASLTSGSKVYDGKKVSASNYQPTLTLRDALGHTLDTIKLTSGQYNISSDSSAVGTYEITLSSAEIKALEEKYSNYDIDFNAVKASFTITSQNIPDNHGGGSSVTPSTPSTPSNPSTPNSSSSSSSSSGPVTPGNVAVKGTVVYAIKKIGLYDSKNFAKHNRKAWYVQKPRIYRPMFVVTGYTRDSNGVLRYKVRDVNHLTKNRGKTGYITASWNYVRPVYYEDSHATITVINPRGVNGYNKASLTGKVKNYKQGTVLKAKKVVSHNLTTRFVLSNGQYVTANRKLVQMGRHAIPTKVRAKGAINRYSNVKLTKRNKHYSANQRKTFKVYGFDYSQANSTKHHGTLRYRVDGGYITGNTKYINIIK